VGSGEEVDKVEQVRAGQLDVAYEVSGPEDGVPVVLLHGFPYDVRAYDEVAAELASRGGCRVVVPWLRGYGPTRFASPDTLRSGQQAVLGLDLLALLDALGIGAAIVGGYDWGGRAACVVSALWPERVLGLVTCGGYNVLDVAGSARPAPPELEHRLWYQWYFHGERGRAGLEANRKPFCRLLWQLWSPSWRFTDEVYERTAASFDNPDFVDVVIHSYRHRFGLVAGDPAAEDVEAALAARPPITVPTVALEGGDNGVQPAGAAQRQQDRFTGRYEVRAVPGVGHDVPQEAPGAFAAAVRALLP
jgi:pimeloyl-ACP methyl ester carboxylesterase